MKAILLSIRPEQVAKILNKEKTIEIRKSIPKCDLPCKVYIYCTKDNSYKLLQDNETGQYFKGITSGNDTIHPSNTEYGMNCEYETQCCTRLNGKVVAEFTLNKANKFDYAGLEFYDMKDLILKKSCLGESELKQYIKNQVCFAWHIDNLIIYEKQIELSKFKTLPCTRPKKACINCKHLEITNTPYTYDKQAYCPIENGKILKKPPQSWCYV